jgi:hypothetical protein
MRAFPLTPFPRKGAITVRGLRPLQFVDLLSPWGGPTETAHG